MLVCIQYLKGKSIMQFVICATSKKLLDSICDTNGIALLHSISV